MATLKNEISIDASIERIWQVLTNVEMLDKYDPTVRRSTALSGTKAGVGARRKVEMQDGKNWFEEECTICRTNEALSFELTACSFPIHKLQHTYSFEKVGAQTLVKQVMHYEMKYGLLGRFLDALIVRKQSDRGIKKFFAGLKAYVENQ